MSSLYMAPLSLVQMVAHVAVWRPHILLLCSRRVWALSQSQSHLQFRGGGLQSKGECQGPVERLATVGTRQALLRRSGFFGESILDGEAWVLGFMYVLGVAGSVQVPKHVSGRSRGCAGLGKLAKLPRLHQACAYRVGTHMRSGPILCPVVATGSPIDTLRVQVPT